MHQLFKKIHHIALKVNDLGKCTAFYHAVLGLPILREQQDDQGLPRSVWLDLGHGMILMLERGISVDRAVSGWHLVALQIGPNDRTLVESLMQAHGIPITGRTDYTLYVEDPEGNRLGFSHWPNKA